MFMTSMLAPGPSRWAGALVVTLDENAGTESTVFLEREDDTVVAAEEHTP